MNIFVLISQGSHHHHHSAKTSDRGRLILRLEHPAGWICAHYYYYLLSSTCNGGALLELPPSPVLFQSLLFSALLHFITSLFYIVYPAQLRATSALRGVSGCRKNDKF